MLTTTAVLVAGALIPQAAASAATMSFSSRCCHDMRIAGDASANRFQLRSNAERIVLHDATPGASINFSLPARCTGEGTATLSCARRSLVDPITLLLDLGPGDSFDTGKAGCAGGSGFALSSGSRASPGAGRGTVWGGPYSDNFTGYGDLVLHGCGGADLLDMTRGVAYGGRGTDFIGARDSARLLGGSGADQLNAADGGVAAGGGGDDQLYDTAGRSALHGGRGDDQVGDPFCAHEGGTGDGRDRPTGGPGRDSLAAGCVSRPVKGEPGAQRLVPTEPDRLDGGRGRDHAQAGHNSLLRRCERITWLPRVIR